MAQAGWTRVCTNEGSEHYPRTDPAVIMAVVDDDDRLLLGHGALWPAGRMSTLAGFVEPGESLEAAVRREVDEEVGITIGEVLYRGSQPWPFPASIMLGFRAHATTTEIHVDGDGGGRGALVQPGVDARCDRLGRAGAVAVHLDRAAADRGLVRRPDRLPGVFRPGLAAQAPYSL